MKNNLIIKVCGMRDGENIRQVVNLGVDWIGMIFYDKSPRNVTMIPTHAGIIPDRGSDIGHFKAKRVGVFVDEMPQSIITRVVNFHLDLIQLHGHETPTLIRNLRATIDPDIRPGIKIIKAISVSSRNDVAAYKDYADCVDFFLFDTKVTAPAPLAPTTEASEQVRAEEKEVATALPGGTGQRFDWSILSAYDGDTPFLLSGGIGPNDAPALCQALTLDGFPVEKCIGIDLNSRFETEPGMKDVSALKAFLNELHRKP